MNPWRNHTVMAGDSEVPVTKHAVTRSQQRSTTLELIEHTINSSKPCHFRGALLYVLGKDDDAPREYRERLKRQLFCVLTDPDSGAVITTYWQDRPEKKKFRRKKSLWRGQRQ